MNCDYKGILDQKAKEFFERTRPVPHGKKKGNAKKPAPRSLYEPFDPSRFEGSDVDRRRG